MLFGEKGIVLLISFSFYSFFVPAILYANEIEWNKPADGLEEVVKGFQDGIMLDKDLLESMMNNRFDCSQGSADDCVQNLDTNPLSRQDGSNDLSGRFYYFISSSMPEKSIKQAIADGEKYRVTFVLRGLLLDEQEKPSFRETVKFLYRLIGEHQVQAQIDPFLFKEYGINSVPYLVFTEKKDPLCPACETEPDNNYVKIGGNITIDYAIEKIAGKNSNAKNIFSQVNSNAN